MGYSDDLFPQTIPVRENPISRWRQRISLQTIHLEPHRILNFIGIPSEIPSTVVYAVSGLILSRRKIDTMPKYGINQTQEIVLLSRLQIDHLPKNQPKNTQPTVLMSIIYSFYRVFNYQLFFNLEQITGKIYL